MSLHPLVGHERERELVLAALAQHRLPQMLLVTGPQGVGKQRFGLWVGQALLCQGATAPPCGQCGSCLQAAQLAHPDLHWFMPVGRPKATEPGKQIEELAEAQGDVLADRRKSPLYPPADGLHGHFVATARLLQRQAALTPVSGRKKVFVIGAADRLVPQESSPEAANALLKLLEEPPADSQFILTAVDATRLLPTIRSRLVPLRLRRLADDQVRGFLGRYSGLDASEVESRVRQAAGSIGRGLAMGTDGSKARPAAEGLLAALSSGATARAERALKQGPWAARGDFTAQLDVLAEQMSEAIRVAAGAAPREQVPEALRRPRSIESLMRASARIQAAREAAQGNVNPQLLLMALSDDLLEVL